MRWRASLLVVGLVLVVAYVSMSGRTSHTVQIDYGWARDMLDSADVEIDGAVVGILQRYGRSNFVTGFRVEPGEHVVRVLTDDCVAVPDTVRLGGGDGRLVTLMADVDDGYTCRVILRGGN
jgi:hypothetical protein